MNITESAKILMKRNGWSQAMLAKAIGIHPVTLCRLLKHPKKRETAYDKLLEFMTKQQLPDE